MDTEFLRFFNLMPYSAMIFKADPPEFTIVAVTDRHLKTLGHTRQDLVGKSVFRVFPTTDNILLGSLIKAVENNYTDILPIIRYDVDGVEKYWNIENIPFTYKGNSYIFNAALDITQFYKS